MYPDKYRVVHDDDTVVGEFATLEEAEEFLLEALNDGEDVYLQTPADYVEAAGYQREPE